MRRVHLVRVTTENGEPPIWLAATPREEAVNRVLDAIPEGWTASLIERQLIGKEAAALDMRPGEVRQQQVS
jgi:hypothetical protein